LAQDLQDEGFHEIQLNGKQLVFLFMAATVVSVVIFLLGVFVGRGVRADRIAVADNPAPVSTVADSSPAPAPAAASAPPAGSDPTAAAPPKEAAEDLSYFNRLEKSNQPAEKLKPAPKEPKPREEPPTPPARVASPAKAVPAEAPAAASASEPNGQGYAVQIAALNVRSDAEAIAKRLSNKGYSAYVVAPPDGTPSVFRVRVGKFPTKREAETIAAKLQKEEQFKPWVTR
jgi:cell division septation protein DedD